MERVAKVSVHGGHSGQFCNHASDSLEDIVCTYIEEGFSWVGITEHAPAGFNEELMYADEREAGLTPEMLLDGFGKYMTECRRLQEKYRSRIQLYAAMEIETCSGYETFVPMLIERFSPDYIVGSVHFVNDICFDYSAKSYQRAAESVGGLDRLYLSYFDLQYDMIRRLKPAVVGHFDLIRIFDAHYAERLQQPEIMTSIRRNLELVKELDLILDFNLRALAKGASEPYISAPILAMVREYEINIAPGDDSHGVANVGNYFDEAVSLLGQLQISTDWPQPSCLQPITGT